MATAEKQQNQSTQEMTHSSQPQQRAGTVASVYPLAFSPAEFFRMNPFSLMRRMTEEIDQLFGAVASNPGNRGRTTAWVPAIEITERDGKYVLRAELPGVKPDDVKLELANDALVLQGERKVDREETKDGIHLTERLYGRFYRSVPLAERARIDEAKAKFENGVLEVTVPAPTQQSQRREIPIEAGKAA